MSKSPRLRRERVWTVTRGIPGGKGMAHRWLEDVSLSLRGPIESKMKQKRVKTVSKGFWTSKNETLSRTY